MKRLIALCLLAAACKRTPAASQSDVLASVHAVDVPNPIADATLAPAPTPTPAREHSILSASCNESNELANGLAIARDAGAVWFSCRTDAGEQMRLSLNVEDGSRPLWFASILYRQLSVLSPARRREEVALTERDMRANRSGQFATPELAMRNPARTIGRVGAIRGTVISAREDGVTVLTVGVGALEITPLQVVYPAPAEEWVVAEARVRMVGYWGEKNGEPVFFAALIERR